MSYISYGQLPINIIIEYLYNFHHYNKHFIQETPVPNCRLSRSCQFNGDIIICTIMWLLYRHPSWKDSYYICNGPVCDYCNNRKRLVFGSHSQHSRRSLLTPVIQAPNSELSNNSVTQAKCNDDLDHPNHSTDIPTCYLYFTSSIHADTITFILSEYSEITLFSFR